jgi:YrbI family 3-deoxy-D-manno-octulosonate 8-phosphate phosphatase
MKFLIAGLGSIGRRHLRNLTALGEQDILLYRTRRSTLPDDDLAAFPVETDLEAALANSPDAVIVANPTSLHLEIAILAAQAGCHILLEKPVSHNFDRLPELQSAVEKSGARILVGYQFRFHPMLQKVSTLLAGSAIGRPLSARTHWGEYLPGWHPWEDYRQSYSGRAELGGGVILTLSHPLDYLRWLFGDVESLWAFTSRQSEFGLDVEDNAEIGLKFKSGMLATVHLDYHQRPPAHHLEIIGTEGTLRWDNTSNQVHLFHASQTKDAGHGSIPTIEEEIIASPQEFERNDLFMAEMRHFLDIVRTGRQPTCSLEDGVQALRLSLAAIQSAEQGTRVSLARPLQTELSAALPKVQALVLDFDGVFTDNRVLVHQDGSEAVLANRSDGTGISRLKNSGLPILVLSNEVNPVVRARANKLGIPYQHGVQDKAAVLQQWLQENHLDPMQVVYVGNDINDLPCMELVGFPVAVADAYPEVIGKASLVLKNSGGKGAIREICDLILSRRKNA